ncbi:phytase [Pseudoluteimonas lycopersici]|uniref:Phytase n=1 Tax=Pseudoluteimonas lycopersici TaxID=1324796 RepID=A0A516V4X5_9GAMM|nr:phytase [Lysobacter lycopersici]QDQ73548.1 phytase [Lysobacter lycopersici]
MRISPVPATLMALLLAACASQPAASAVPPSPDSTPAATAPKVLLVPESFVSAETPAEELDSVATWTAPDGHTLAIVTGKSTHRLDVYDGDSGQRLREVGSEGSAPGQFFRPNGIAIADDKLFVVERDNHRVQVLSLPGFEPVGSFGEGELRSPYGLWINQTEPGELEVYVTDSFMYGKHYDVVPPYSELDQRVRRYRVQFDQDGKLMANYGGAFGDTSKEYGLRMVESIAGDARNDRMLIADEDTRHLSTLREYGFSGKFTGRSLPQDSFGAQAEGVALWTCPDGSGYWIAVDQLAPLTIFHLFDRKTLAPVGSFTGKVTSHTDGVALHGPTKRFPGGVLYAVHDDKALAAFDLREVARTLRIAPTCLQQ